MNKIKNLFCNYDLTWKRLIIFSIICGVITGIIPLISILNKTSFHNISECYEMWVLLAMFVILNSKRPLESGIKTFVFFLISQPLCYLVQVPFYRDGFGIFMYYPYWAKLTVLTFPGAIIAWYTKKENWLSVIFLSVAIMLLDLELTVHFKKLISSFPYQLFAVIFIIFEVIFLINIIFNNKSKRIVLYIISVLFLIGIVFYLNNSQPIQNHIAIYTLSEDKVYDIVEKDDAITIDFIDDSLVVKSKETGNFTFKIKDSDNNILEFSFRVLDDYVNLEIVNNN